MQKTGKKTKFILIIIIYLAGIFMGALDTGIVTPARTLIQNNLGVGATEGIWMITIYTLAYAASIPVMGKLADRYGRKYVYLISILLFGLGSLFCGLSQNFGGFAMLLTARSVQAIGGGGIMPVATAEFGTTFPPEKRGMALGLVGGVYGIANIFGASAGSAILDIFGKTNWQFIFYINVPITLFIVIAGILTLKNSKPESSGRIDGLGITILVVMILSLLYGLKNLDFFNIPGTITTTGVYPFLIIFAVLIPAFVLTEKKAQDAVMNLKYFTNRNIALTLLISFISGFVMMGIIFVPQFSENALKIASGSGGYLVIILGAFAGIGAPISGRLIDKFGAKLILGFGFLVSITGAAFLIFITTSAPSFLTVFISLMLMGLGMGFTMGTPLNYMMLANTENKESNSSLAALSLIRSIGTAIAPAIMVGFIAHAGASVQDNVMSLLPTEINMPELPYAQEITDEMNKLKTDPNMKDSLKDMNMPDLTSMTSVKIKMDGNSGYKMPADLIELMQSSDVTTITANAKTLAARMFKEMTPAIIQKIQKGILAGSGGISSGIEKMKSAAVEMTKGYDGINEGIKSMTAAVKGQKEALGRLQGIAGMMGKMGGTRLPPGMTLADMIPENVRSGIPESAMKELEKLTSVEELNTEIKKLEDAAAALEIKIKDSEKSAADMEAALDKMDQTIAEMESLKSKMTELSAAVPAAFDTALDNYLAAINEKSAELETTFQSTLNGGFRNVYLTAAIASVLALLLLAFYMKKRENLGSAASNQ